MKIKTNCRPLGNVLMLTLLMAVVISTALASYLAFVSNQNQSIARSMSWNAAMAIAESGVEEALAQVNLCGYTNYVNTNANAWELGADSWYHKTRSFSDGSYYYVSIHPIDPPVIISSGYVVAPLSTPTFTAFGLLSGQFPDNSSSTRYVNRTVRIVTTKPLSQGTAGFKAKSLIRFSLNGTLDSYNSALGPYKRLDNAKAVTNSRASGAVQLGTAKIYGSVQTGDGGTVTYTSGGVGTSEWNDGNPGIQADHFSDDADARFDDVPVPFTSGFTPTGGTWSGTNVTYLLPDGDYYYNNLLSPINLNIGKAMVVTGKVRLYTTGDFYMSGSGFIYIAPGASLELYVGKTLNVSGTGVINGTGSTDKLTIYGLNTSLTAAYSGSTTFVGSMNMPYAALGLSGTAGLFGSFTANTITVNGSSAVHIDEALGATPGNGYVVASWNELAPNAALY